MSGIWVDVASQDIIDFLEIAVAIPLRL